MTKNDLTVIYYTCNYLETANPDFLFNTKTQLVKAIGDLPLIVVSHKPVAKESFIGYEGEYSNIVLGDIGRSHLNIYKQIMIGAQNAKTKYVAMAEDDILYSKDHFFSAQIDKEFNADPNIFLYDMNKLSLFTWTEPPIFSFRSKRKVVNQLIANAKMLAEAMEERFKRLDELKASGRSEESIIKYWGDPGRYEHLLGVTPRKSVEFYCATPSIVFTHSKAFGYEFNHGKRKRHGDIKIVELLEWGRAEDVLKLWGKVSRQ